VDRKIAIAGAAFRPVDGHAPELAGRALNTDVAAGTDAASVRRCLLVSDDHARDLAKLVVAQRHRGTGRVGRGARAALSFLALPVVPAIRLSDHGLVDVRRASLVNLFVAH